SMVPDKKIRQTQVGDVALALKLHRQQIDPRKAGYDAVIADPTLTFQPYSLGFESDEMRQRSRKMAQRLLGSKGPD
ncbi:MAG: hypothetical protein AAF802_29435, partial [Planctomycetota bacterium]